VWPWDIVEMYVVLLGEGAAFWSQECEGRKCAEARGG